MYRISVFCIQATHMPGLLLLASPTGADFHTEQTDGRRLHQDNNNNRTLEGHTAAVQKRIRPHIS